MGHEYLSSLENRTKANPTGCPVCAKEKHTSFPEQVLFFYLKKAFPDAINRWTDLGKEIDIYLPSVKLGVEYDGYLYHNQETKVKESKKDEFFRERGIRLFRVKEYRDEIIESNENIIYISERGNQYRNIEKALYDLTKILEIDYASLDVNLERDNISIIESYYTSFKEQSLAVKRPQIAAEWNFEKNGTLKPEQVSWASGKKIWWICEKGHEYQSPIVNRTSNKSGCPYCSGQRVMKGFNDLETNFPNIAIEWHPTKNGDLTSNQVSSKTSKKVWWLCPKGHAYFSTIAGRTGVGAGCPYCAGKIAISGETDLGTKFPALLKEWDYNKNQELDPTRIMPYSHQKAWWICTKGHSYEMSISSRTGKGSKCPICSNNQLLAGYNDLESKFPEVAKLWDLTKNGNLKPNAVSPYSTMKVWWIDEKTGVSKLKRIDSTVGMYVKKHRGDLKQDD